MFRMDDMGTFEVFSKFKSHILSYKQDAEFENLCFVNKARASLWFTCVYHIINEHIESVYLICHESFGQKKVNQYFILFVNNYLFT